jgi:hypothetical protein
MADLRDFTGKNAKFTGTIGERISVGTTAERNTAAYGQGTLRFNSTTQLLEYYNGSEWKSIDAPPTITTFNVNGAGNVTTSDITKDSSTVTIAINGSLFDTVGATVLFVGTGGGDVSPITTTRNNANLITITVSGNSFSNTFEPYDIKVTNGSGLSATLENCITSQTAPAFSTASGSLGTIREGTRSSYTLLPVTATDADGDTITYSISSGSLPAGLSLNSSTGAITGTASSVGSNTTSTFTVLASTATLTATRSFSITVNAPVITSYTTGSGSFAVPVGVTAVNVLLIGGGAGGGGRVGGGGGAGGYVDRPGFPVTPGGTVSYSIGGGGGGGGPSQQGNDGTPTTFGSLTAIGGGGGGGDNNQAGRSGGSGGGTQYSGNPPSPPGSDAGGVGSGTQPSQPGNSGTFGFGNPGGSSRGAPHHSSGGGGGAGGAGQSGTTSKRGDGGPGKSSSISGSSVTRAGGGGGGGHPDSSTQGLGGPGGGGNGGPPSGGVAQSATVSNSGSGGGGNTQQPNPGDTTAGAGAAGVVIIAY